MLPPLADSAPVRLADTGDEEALVAMAQRMHADPEWGMRDWDGLPFPFDEAKVRAIIQAATVRGRNAPDAGGSWIGIVEIDGRVHGSVCLRLVEPALSGGEYLDMVWSWVAPEYRRGPAAQLLLNFALAIADRHQRTLVSADRMYENGGRARFLQRRIGRPTHSVFAYNSAAGTA